MILHVEDNELVVSYLRRMLEFKGWKVEACMDGEAALRKIESEVPYDLIILDQQLPGVSGLELLSRAHSLAHRRWTPVVMYTCSDLEPRHSQPEPMPLLVRIVGLLHWSIRLRGWRYPEIRKLKSGF